MTTAEYSKPVPTPDATSTPYFQACAEGRLLIQRCPACEHRQHYPRPLCLRCGATPEWDVASGRGVVYTFTIIRQMGVAPFSAQTPYVVAMIELEEGVRMMGNVLGIDVDQVRVGLPVEAVMVAVSDELAVPNWRVRGLS